ncbi:MAG: polysaccharide deacetylase family protein [Bacteroidales bacterium]
MYFVRIPKIAKLIYKNMIWDIPVRDKTIFLTFDDGPERFSTPAILEILKKYDANATFFCTGKKAKENPELLNQIISAGHTLGNHSYSHLKMESKGTDTFIQDINKFRNIFDSELFRPPYGKITRKQINILKDNYKIIMWSVIPGDFDRKVSKERMLKRSIKYTKQGSIIVFHDNSKTIEKVEYALPRFLDHFINKGFAFKSLSTSLFP